MTINRAVFFRERQQHLGLLSQSAVDSLNLFLDYWEMRGGLGYLSLPALAYVMATAHGEVGSKLEPVREGFKATDEAARRHVANLLKAGKIKTNYAKADPITGMSYYGRGFAQLTHKSGYATAGNVLGLDLVNNPDLALRPDVATQVIFLGMERGWFAGDKQGRHTLDRYFGGKVDFMGARRIVNGTDKAEKFADLARAYLACLRAANVAPAEPEPPPPEVKPPVPDADPPPEAKPPAPQDALGRAIVMMLALAAAAAGSAWAALSGALDGLLGWLP